MAPANGKTFVGAGRFHPRKIPDRFILRFIQPMESAFFSWGVNLSYNNRVEMQ